MTDKFENDLKRVIDDDAVDERTLKELAVRRRAVLEAAHRKPRAAWWLPAGAVAAALLAVVIMRDGDYVAPVADTDDAIDLQILMAEDNLELYEDLDFFEWLSTVDDETG